MAGENFWKERPLFTLTSTGASLTNNSGAAAGDLDARALGNAAQDFAISFLLTCQWATVTGIAAGSKIADLYLVPKVDGTNLPQIDLTAGSSYIPFSHRADGFIASKVPVANTNTLFATYSLGQITLMPLLYTAHLMNKSGQTISVNWKLEAVSARKQYS